MDRNLMSKILTQMKRHLREGKPIGDLKVGSLLALGHQLEAIFYYLGHELGSMIKAKEVEEPEKIPDTLTKIISEFNIGDVEIMNSSEDNIQLRLKNHSSIKHLINKGIKSSGSFCSFEAGLLAGIVENVIDIHCFAQETSCSLETGKDYCEFMIVFQKD
jgi:predicted hydrocarbon binding protein